ncbi:hypothetical protein GGS23DRAFT_552344 [Durotheca rogersii]|uniref:uncharacterized protein n=1 Tax=Durotheca rogersii TaxID=419775 RepID=UPI002220198D|nr:uncharacterized protein GGS23DRAFT_552344 [Durotheca rogersii]KAI5866836.1 hypothetical protein GGS23DRAFT_552344 [Durotheca rogersii]
MALPLAPLVQLTTGEVHPAFPGTLLHFWLLTDSQLEALAHFYHQRTPCPWTRHYPCPVRWASDAPLEEKRRRLGRFIGLRGCESPLVLLPSSPTAAAPADSAAPALLSEDDILEEARAARLAEEERIWRGKHPWFRG